MAKKAKKADKSEVEEQLTQTTDQMVAQNNFLLHVLIDYLIEKELISKAEFQDRLDLVESELFISELECKPKKKKKK